jgi:hypothetical protein
MLSRRDGAAFSPPRRIRRASCANNPKLRREVESLLAHEGEADTLLENPAWNHVTPHDGATAGALAGALPVGAILAAYGIIGKLGPKRF